MDVITHDGDHDLEVIATHGDFVRAANLSPAELTEFHHTKLLTVLFHIGQTFVLMAAVPFAYLLLPHWIMIPVCMLVMVRVYNCLSQLVHASNHGELFVNHRANEIVGNVLAYFLGFTKSGHAASHHSHHIHLNTNRDPDRVFLGVTDPRAETVHRMTRLLLLDLFMVSAARRLLQYLQTDKKRFDASPWQKLSLSYVVRGILMQLPVAAAQCSLLALYWATIGPQYYFLFCIFPLFSLYTAQSRLRFFVEHAFEADYVPNSQEKVWVTRTIKANLLERFVMAPLGMPYHFEHHLFPTIPYYNLPKLHRRLIGRGTHVPTANGYLRFLAARWRDETKRTTRKNDAYKAAA